MKTILYEDVYVLSRSSVVGPVEANGPLYSYFDKTYKDLYASEKSFEKAECKMVYDACDIAVRKANFKRDDIEIALGGDLLNQIMSSNYFARDLHCSFIGMYGACATSSLIIGQAALWIESGHCQNALCFTSSHYASAEKQYRYPNEYGIQKKETCTYTVTGAAACILTHQKTNIKVRSFTIGEIVDWQFKDANDMGSAMAPAAFETIQSHLKNRNQTFADYDLIVTGDLSKIGHQFIKQLFKHSKIDTFDRLLDCGLMIFDKTNKTVKAGGSGCACSMVVSMTTLLDKIEKGIYKRILVVATGALLSPIALQQKDSIPCIAHAIEYEWSKIE